MARKHSKSSKKRTHRQRRHIHRQRAGGWGFTGSSSIPGTPGTVGNPMVYTGIGDCRATEPGYTIPTSQYGASMKGLPGMSGGKRTRKSGKGKTRKHRQRGGRYGFFPEGDVNPSGQAWWAGSYAPIQRIACEGTTQNPLNPTHTGSSAPPGAANPNYFYNPLKGLMSGGGQLAPATYGVGNVDSMYHYSPTAGYANTASTWLDSVGAPVQLQVPFAARSMNQACLSTGGHPPLTGALQKGGKRSRKYRGGYDPTVGTPSPMPAAPAAPAVPAAAAGPAIFRTRATGPPGPMSQAQIAQAMAAPTTAGSGAGAGPGPLPQGQGQGQQGGKRNRKNRTRRGGGFLNTITESVSGLFGRSKKNMSSPGAGATELMPVVRTTSNVAGMGNVYNLVGKPNVSPAAAAANIPLPESPPNSPMPMSPDQAGGRKRRNKKSKSKSRKHSRKHLKGGMENTGPKYKPAAAGAGPAPQQQPQQQAPAAPRLVIAGVNAAAVQPVQPQGPPIQVMGNPQIRFAFQQ